MVLKHTTGGEATGRAFYQGRHHYVELLKEKVDDSNDNLILILGPRRIGKTTIVKQFFLEQNQDQNDSGIYIYIYIPKINDLVEFYKVAINGIERVMKENGGNKKFLSFTTKSSIQKTIGSIMDRIGEISIAGYGLKVNKVDEWEKYVSLLSTIKDEFITIITEMEKDKVVIGFDEVPEAIQYLLSKDKEKGKEEVEIWLEHFREMRHCSELVDKINLILFGSVNMKLTLEKLGQSKVINDNFTIDINPLDIKQVKELFWDLVDTLKYNVLKSNEAKLNTFLEKMFTYSSPWAIQNFLAKFDKKKAEKDLEKSLQEAYLALFDITGGGVRYLQERLKNHYQPGELDYIKAVLKYLVKMHVEESIEIVSDDELFTELSKEDGIKDREDYQRIIDILLLDNMIYRGGSGFSVKNTVEKNFWYTRMVGSCKF